LFFDHKKDCKVTIKRRYLFENAEIAHTVSFYSAVIPTSFKSLNVPVIEKNITFTFQIVINQNLSKK